MGHVENRRDPELPATERRNLSVPRKTNPGPPLHACRPRRPEERLHVREGLRTEDLESFGGYCSGYVRPHSWPVITQADGRSGRGGAQKESCPRYPTSDRE